MTDQNLMEQLEQEHHALNKQIAGLESTGRFSDHHMQELKKQKLHLRDRIEQLKKENQHG
jgi:hypothetical protein